jgi:iron complex transport system substrate-binding protein
MRRSLVAVGLAAVLVLSACGSDDDGASAPSTDAPPTTAASTTAAATTMAPATTMPSARTTATATGFPLTVTGDNGDVTLDAAPEAIVSLSPTATEMLFAIDAGDRVVAVDDQSTYPPEAPITDLSGFNPNIEAIAGHEPDLVIVSYDANGVIAGLEALDIPVLQLDAVDDLDGAYAQIETLGEVTGQIDEADQLVADMRDKIAAISARVQGSGLTYFHELDELLYTATSSTFIGQLYAMLGLENVADPADTDKSGYPQLSTEFLLDADPSLIFLADTKCCGQNADTVAARPGWGQLSAVANGNVVSLDDDIASRWGPRVVDLLEAIAAGIDKATD